MVACASVKNGSQCVSSDNSFKVLTNEELEEKLNDSWGYYHYKIMQMNFRYLSAEQMKRIYLIMQEDQQLAM